ERDLTNIKWNDSAAEYVVESTGVFITLEETEAYLSGWSKKQCLLNYHLLGPPGQGHPNNFGIVEGLKITEDCGEPMGSCGVMAEGLPKHHPLFCWYCQGYGQGHL
ncbi:Glyceraldehyde-3-phosphate dehydrogenase, partial [Galemys pyrenaicus]